LSRKQLLANVLLVLSVLFFVLLVAVVGGVHCGISHGYQGGFSPQQLYMWMYVVIPIILLSLYFFFSGSLPVRTPLACVLGGVAFVISIFYLVFLFHFPRDSAISFAGWHWVTKRYAAPFVLALSIVSLTCFKKREKTVIGNKYLFALISSFSVTSLILGGLVMWIS